MPTQTVATAQIKCSFGLSPAVLSVVPAGITVEGKPAATIMDYAPVTNIPTFGMCTTQSNPAVAAATSAAMGTPTPAPCVPATVAPWSPGASSVMLGGKPALNSSSTCNCAYGGVISIVSSGATQTNIP